MAPASPARRLTRRAMIILPYMFLSLFVLMLLPTHAYKPHQPKTPPHNKPSLPLHSRATHLQQSLGRLLLAGGAGLLTPALLSLPQPTAAMVDVGLRKQYVDPTELWQLEYPMGWYLSRRDPTPQSEAPAGVVKASSTVLVVADYTTGATASVVRTSLSSLVKEGMGWGTLMPMFGGLGSISKFEDLLEGKGVAALLMRDRDGQLKVSALAPPQLGKILESETSANDGFLSRLVDCTPHGKAMEFKVKTPINRIPGSAGSAMMGGAGQGGGGGMSDGRLPIRGRPLRKTSDVFKAIGDASPIERRANPSSESVSTSRAATAPTLIRQQADVRVSKAKAYLRDDGSILTAWVSADKRSWEDPDASARLDAILESFDVAPR